MPHTRDYGVDKGAEHEAQRRSVSISGEIDREGFACVGEEVSQQILGKHPQIEGWPWPRSDVCASPKLHPQQFGFLLTVKKI